jgi:hypothetical protein
MTTGHQDRLGDNCANSSQQVNNWIIHGRLNSSKKKKKKASSS